MESIQLKKVEILLDKVETKHQSGQLITGTVHIALNGELELSRVNIVLRSMSEVEWLEIHGTKYKDGHVFRDNEQYLNVVYEIPDNVRKTVITSGEHSIPFEFELPDEIPSSFETLYGFIHYWIEVIINDSLDHELYRIKNYFNVESPLRHGIHLSVGGGTEKEFGMLSLGSGKVRIDASIRKKGHTPGETVEVHCLVTNTSTVAVTPRASFYKTQIFMAKERHKTRGSVSEAVVCEKVNAGETRDQIISVTIPNDMPLSIKTRLISVKYFIHVTLDIPHALDLHLNLPIIITNEYAFDERSASFL